MIYEVISDVTIRREPRIVEYQDPATKKIITNATGKLTVGTHRKVYSTVVDKNNAIWGRISESDGKVYVVSEDGVTTVFEAGPQFKIVAENDLGDYTLSSPAVVDGQIFLRTTKYLYCIGTRKSAQ